MSGDENKSYLAREVIYQALRDVVFAYEKATPEEKASANRFAFDNSAKDGAFLWCCKRAGLDPEAVRAELKKRG